MNNDFCVCGGRGGVSVPEELFPLEEKRDQSLERRGAVTFQTKTETSLCPTPLRIKGFKRVLPEGLRIYPEPFSSEEPFFEVRVQPGFH